MTPKLRIALLAFTASLSLDVLTKYLVTRHLVFSDRVEVVEGFFYLTHVRNPGAAFGLFATWHSEWRLGFFIGISLLALGIVVSFFRKLAPGDRLSALALGFISGGAVGNLIDRIAYGEVIDFLDVYYEGWHWPAFNVADSAISVGAAILIAESFLHRDAPRERGADRG